MQAFPASCEFNRTIPYPQPFLAAPRARYEADALVVENVDGLSMSFESWRFNLRLSNTEPVVRLNVESRGNEALMREKTAELLALMAQL